MAGGEVIAQTSAGSPSPSSAGLNECRSRTAGRRRLDRKARRSCTSAATNAKSAAPRRRTRRRPTTAGINEAMMRPGAEQRTVAETTSQPTRLSRYALEARDDFHTQL